MKIARISQHSFIIDPICSSSIVLDCGVNNAYFSTAIYEKAKCIIHGFEPDPRYFKKLPHIPNCKFHPLAISDKSTNMRLNIGERHCSSLCLRENVFQDFVEVDTTTIAEYAAENQIERIDLVKMDVEGAEIPILSSLDKSFIRNKIVQITVEFHDHIDRNARPQIKKVIEKFKNNNFECVVFSCFTFSDVLFINKQFIELSPFDLVHIQLIKYIRGINRNIKRILGYSE